MEVNCCGDLAGGNQSTVKQSEVIDLRVPDEAIPGSEKCVVNIIGAYLQTVHSHTSVQCDHMQFVIRKKTSYGKRNT